MPHTHLDRQCTTLADTLLHAVAAYTAAAVADVDHSTSDTTADAANMGAAVDMAVDMDSGCCNVAAAMRCHTMDSCYCCCCMLHIVAVPRMCTAVDSSFDYSSLPVAFDIVSSSLAVVVADCCYSSRMRAAVDSRCRCCSLAAAADSSDRRR